MLRSQSPLWPRREQRYATSAVLGVDRQHAAPGLARVAINIESSTFYPFPVNKSRNCILLFSSSHSQNSGVEDWGSYQHPQTDARTPASQQNLLPMPTLSHLHRPYRRCLPFKTTPNLHCSVVLWKTLFIIILHCLCSDCKPYCSSQKDGALYRSVHQFKVGRK